MDFHKDSFSSMDFFADADTNPGTAGVSARRVVEVAVVGDFREHRRSNNPIKWPLTQLIELLISLFLWQKFLKYILRKCLSRIFRSSILAPAHTNHLLIRVEVLVKPWRNPRVKLHISNSSFLVYSGVSNICACWTLFWKLNKYLLSQVHTFCLPQWMMVFSKEWGSISFVPDLNGR